MRLNYKDITPVDLRDYVKSLGWEQMEQALQDGLFLLTNRTFARRQLIFPTDSDAPDYADAVKAVLNKLSEVENKPLEAIMADLTELNDDTIRFRVVDSRNENNFIPLNYAVTAITGVKDLLRSAASTVMNPQLYHRGRSWAEAQELLDKSRFRQTEKGSFVIKVSTPVRAIPGQTVLFEGEQAPFVRKTMLTVHNSIEKIVSAIQTDRLPELIRDTKASQHPDISANLCNAIGTFREPNDDYDVYIDFSWATAYPVSKTLKNEIKIQKDYFSRIYDIAYELRSDNPEYEEKTFVGSVEHLAGVFDNNGQRTGEVILSLFDTDDLSSVRARAYLTAEQYKDADEAHMNHSIYIKVTGKLLPGYQPRLLSEITAFETLKYNP